MKWSGGASTGRGDAKRLGAVIEAVDVRPAVTEQVAARRPNSVAVEPSPPDRAPQV
jgi:NAD/NADP transhydrogenase alpha subunit